MTKGYDQRKNANEKYLSTQDTIIFRTSKESGLKEEMRAHAEKMGESIQAFIIRAIQETMTNDNDNHKRIKLDGEKPEWIANYTKEE